MLQIKVFALVFFFLSCLVGNAQQHDPIQNSFEKAFKLYKQKNYEATYALLKKNHQKLPLHSSLAEEAAFYLALSAVKLDKEETDALLKSFEQNHPTSLSKDALFLEAGVQNFNRGQYEKSIKWFQKASFKQLAPEERESHHFKMGYALLSEGDHARAKGHFFPLTTSKTHGDEANYYYGYLALLDKDFKTALRHFEKISNTTRFQKEILHHQSTLYFQRQEYQKALEKGLHLLEITSEEDVSEISKIVGESYFYLKKYPEAIEHLTKYKGRHNKLSTNDRYFLGHAYYKQKDFKNAVKIFNKITDGTDVVAQNAYYHLADCYLKRNQKSAALNAFKNASEMNHDAAIKEISMFNYAKLSYEIGNPYQNVPSVLEHFIVNYPQSEHAALAKKLMVKSYLRSQDHAGALGYYQKQGIPKDKTYYKIALFRALELFQIHKYADAIPFFKTATLQLMDQKTQAKALYWKGETHYRLQQYQKALSDFQHFEKHRESTHIPEHKSIAYSQAYAHFKNKKFDRAIVHFERYLKTNPTDKSKKKDSYLRLADANFVSKNYAQALIGYDKAIQHESVESDHASFQKALCLGFTKRSQAKITLLTNFSKKYPQSQYRDDALFALGSTYANAQKNEEAIKTFDALLKTHPKSIFAAEAVLKKGLVHYNNHQPEKAIAAYRAAVANYPNTQEAKQAVQNARQVYIDLDRVDAYAQWVESIGHVEFSNTDLDNTMFEAAELKFLENKVSQALTSLDKYLLRFPKGIHHLKARFYRARAHLKTGDQKKARKDLEFILGQNANRFLTKSLILLAEIHLENSLWEEAIPLLKRLEQEGNSPKEMLFAQSNLMKALFQKKAYSETLDYAKMVLKNPKTNPQIKADAYLFSARAAFETGQEQKSEEAYRTLSKIATGTQKAESLYYEAYFKHRAGEYEASNRCIEILASEHANQKIWGLKGLVLMARNNEKIGDLFQARFILKSLIENYKDAPDRVDMVREAQELLRTFEKESKKNNLLENPAN